MAGWMAAFGPDLFHDKALKVEEKAEKYIKVSGLQTQFTSLWTVDGRCPLCSETLKMLNMTTTNKPVDLVCANADCLNSQQNIFYYTLANLEVAKKFWTEKE